HDAAALRRGAQRVAHWKETAGREVTEPVVAVARPFGGARVAAHRLLQGLQAELPGERLVTPGREEHVRATPIERQIGVSRERSRVLERRGVVRDDQIRTR